MERIISLSCGITLANHADISTQEVNRKPMSSWVLLTPSKSRRPEAKAGLQAGRRRRDELDELGGVSMVRPARRYANVGHRVSSEARFAQPNVR